MTKEAEILAAAEDEFFRNGFDATSTATIARRAGVTHAMVNYYFRTKEQLFVKIIDIHIQGFLDSLKKVMFAEGDFLEVVVGAATALFDKIREDRKFPFILLDISRTHPEFLLRYRETVETICRESIERHAQRLAEQIRAGKVATCTLESLFDTVLDLAAAPFLKIPFLEQIAGFDAERIDRYLLSRREDLVTTLQRKYATKR